MIYNINTAAQVNMVVRQEMALRAGRTGKEQPRNSSGSKTNKVLWMIVQLFGAPRLF